MTQKFLLAIMLVLLAVLVWTHAGSLGLNPASLEPTTRIAQPTTRAHLYLGPPHSVAVLPFNCVRTGPEGAADAVAGPAAEVMTSDAHLVFPSGLAQSVTDLLIENDDLHVIHPISTFFFANSTSTYDALAEWLRVRFLLDGCFRPGDETSALDAWLYDARTSKFRWSDQYPVSDQAVFEVVNQLTSQTTEHVRSNAVDQTPMAPEQSFAVWKHMMDGWSLVRRGGEVNLLQAQDVFQRVIEEDPEHAPAWVGLALTYLHPQWPVSDEVAGYEKAREAAQQALVLDSETGRAFLVLSQISRIYDWDFETSRELAQRALEVLPGDAEVLANASSAEFVLGRYEPAIEWLEESISRNPVVLNKLLKLGLAYEFAGNLDQALISYRQLQGFNDHYPGVHAYRARIKLAEGKMESALKEAELEVQPFWQRYARIIALDALERLDESDPLLDQMIQENGNDAAVQLAEIYALRQEPDQAFTWLERALEQRDGGIREILGNPFLVALHDDPRWAELLSRIGLSP